MFVLFEISFTSKTASKEPSITKPIRLKRACNFFVKTNISIISNTRNKLCYYVIICVIVHDMSLKLGYSCV